MQRISPTFCKKCEMADFSQETTLKTFNHPKNWDDCGTKLFFKKNQSLFNLAKKNPDQTPLQIQLTAPLKSTYP